MNMQKRMYNRPLKQKEVELILQEESDIEQETGSETDNTEFDCSSSESDCISSSNEILDYELPTCFKKVNINTQNTMGNKTTRISKGKNKKVCRS